MRQRADFRNHGKRQRGRQPTDPSAPLQRLIAAIGARTREALWAEQLIERKAAVARWRSGQFGTRRGPRGGKERRP